MESITSSNYLFREHNGRMSDSILRLTFWRVGFFVLIFFDRYHGIPDNPYFHPCDESEKYRLDGLQYIFRATFGRNIMVPLGPKPTLIIDVGTGSG